jgi:hypothetical protein
LSNNKNFILFENLVIVSKKLMLMFKQMHFLIDHPHHYLFHNQLAKIFQRKSKQAM